MKYAFWLILVAIFLVGMIGCQKGHNTGILSHEEIQFSIMPMPNNNVRTLWNEILPGYEIIVRGDITIWTGSEMIRLFANDTRSYYSPGIYQDSTMSLSNFPISIIAQNGMEYSIQYSARAPSGEEYPLGCTFVANVTSVTNGQTISYELQNWQQATSGETNENQVYYGLFVRFKINDDWSINSYENNSIDIIDEVISWDGDPDSTSCEVGGTALRPIVQSDSLIYDYHEEINSVMSIYCSTSFNHLQPMQMIWSQERNRFEHHIKALRNGHQSLRITQLSPWSQKFMGVRVENQFGATELINMWNYGEEDPWILFVYKYNEFVPVNIDIYHDLRIGGLVTIIPGMAMNQQNRRIHETDRVAYRHSYGDAYSRSPRRLGCTS